MFSLPEWIEEMPRGPAKRIAIARFYLRISALYTSERGTLELLAEEIGVNYNCLKSQATGKARPSSYTTTMIQQTLGPEFDFDRFLERL